MSTNVQYRQEYIAKFSYCSVDSFLSIYKIFPLFDYRDEASGEVANQNLFIPGLLPKVPGRFYYLFGKPIRTKGKESMLQDKNNANQLYLQIKSEVEHNINYLIKKREEDPYRNIVDRIMYQAIYPNDTPTFKP